MEILQRDIKVALVGDACVGKTHWCNVGMDGEEKDEYKNPTIGNYEIRKRGYTSTIGTCFFDFWDISGSHSTPHDRAKWIEDSDAAIIMVDLADQESIDNIVLWYREIMSSQQHSNNPKHLPVTVFASKAYEDDAIYKTKPTEFSLPEEMGSTPFHYNEYCISDSTNYMTDATHFYAMVTHDKSTTRPLMWILEQLTGQPEVRYTPHYPPAPDSGFWVKPDPEGLEEYRREMARACECPLPDEDEADL